MILTNVLRWFSGGQPGYMPLLHCMNHDYFWVGLTVVLDLAIACGFLMIALQWRAQARQLPDGPPKQALGRMKKIFIFCGICGYLFIPVKMVWPAWRLYDIFLAILINYTWRYTWSARDLKVIHYELGRSTELARDLEESRAQSRRKSFFLNAVSHDLRTPLNGLGLHADLAEIYLQTSDDEGLRESLAEIKAATRATADLLNRFLELGRMDWSEDQVHSSTFDLGEALHDARRATQALADQKGLTLKVDVPSGLTVHTDRSKLERIVMNLLTNAVKFTQAGGVSISAEVAGADVAIAVADTGPGIADEHQPRIFDEFYQVHNGERNRSKGFGLGLAIAQRLAQQLGGTLGLDSQLGRGSRFVLGLPGALRRDRSPAEPAKRAVAV